MRRILPSFRSFAPVRLCTKPACPVPILCWILSIFSRRWLPFLRTPLWWALKRLLEVILAHLVRWLFFLTHGWLVREACFHGTRCDLFHLFLLLNFCLFNLWSGKLYRWRVLQASHTVDVFEGASFGRFGLRWVLFVNKIDVFRVFRRWDVRAGLILLVWFRFSWRKEQKAFLLIVSCTLIWHCRDSFTRRCQTA